ncbi:MAG: hypothetical protein RMA76_28700 [Deltaproteobacteria bacterium]
MAVRIDPTPTIGTTVASAVRLLTDSRLRYERLLEIATHGRDYLGGILQQIADGDSDLAHDLKVVLPRGTKPTPDALIAGLFTLLVDDGPDDVHLRDEVPFDALTQYGQPGALVAATISAIDQRTRNIPAGAEELAAMQAVLRKLAPDAAFVVRRSASLEASLPPAPTAAVAEVKRLGPEASSVRFDNVLFGLTYGATPLITALAKEITDNPKSPLSAALRTRGRQQYTGPRRAALVARLLRLLDAFKDPHDPTGINLELFAQTYGEVGESIAKQLIDGAQRPVPERPNFDFMAQIVEALGVMMGPRHALPLVDRLVRHDALIPKRVPAIDKALEYIPEGRFAGRGLIAIQHMFPTFIPLLEAFERRGMSARDVHVLGTKYASNPLVATYGRLKGYHLERSGDDAGSTRSFEALRLHEVLAFLGSVSVLGRKPKEGWIALDDGGLLNGLLSGLKEVDSPFGSAPDIRASIEAAFGGQPVHGVEQTTRGLTELLLNEEALTHFIVTVANAPGKIAEGGIIAWDLAKALLMELHHRGKVDALERVGVVSGGTVGLELSKRLAEDLAYDVTVVDKDDAKRERAEGAGLAVSERVRETVKLVDLLFPCTGKRSVNGFNLQGFEGMLASGSSAAIEGDTDHIQAFNGDVDVFNWFRPLNFSGDGHEQLSKEQIGLTRALLLLACAQELPTDGAPRMVPLTDVHHEIVDFWRKTGGDEVEPLSRAPQHRLRPPDLYGPARRAPHDEWMTFFMNHPGRVHPPPTSTRRVPAVYLFQLPNGQVRAVDTRIGRSFKLPVDTFPEKVTFLGVPPGDFDVLLRGGEGEDAWALPVRLTKKKLEVGERRAGGEVVASRWSPPSVPEQVQPEDADMFLIAQKEVSMPMSVLVAKDGQLTAYRDGDVESADVFDAPTDAPCHYLWPEPNVVVAIEKSGGRLHAVGDGARAWANRRLPEAMVQVDAISSQFAPSRGAVDPIAIGRDADGRTVLGGLGGAMVRLPEGAVFRGIEKKDPDAMAPVYVVRYSEDDEAVDELDHHHTVELDLGS